MSTYAQVALKVNARYKEPATSPTATIQSIQATKESSPEQSEEEDSCSPIHPEAPASYCLSPSQILSEEEDPCCSQMKPEAAAP